MSLIVGVSLIYPDHSAGSSIALVRGLVWHCSSRQYTVEAVLQVTGAGGSSSDLE